MKFNVMVGNLAVFCSYNPNPNPNPPLAHKLLFALVIQIASLRAALFKYLIERLSLLAPEVKLELVLNFPIKPHTHTLFK